jgi:hypothetical protein
MNPFRSTIVAITVAASASTFLLGRIHAQDAPQPRPPQPSAGGVGEDRVAAEKEAPSSVFFDALQRRPERRSEAIRRLCASIISADPAAGPDPKEVLHLGLAYLWSASSAADRSERFEQALLARHWLERAMALAPEDDRIGSWRWSAAALVADLEQDDAALAAARRELVALADVDPCFHALALGIVSFADGRTSPAFRAALDAMNTAFACTGDDPSIRNRPRWPFNVQGFLVGLADMRLKAGDLPGAEAALVIAEANESTPSWRFKALLDERFATLKVRAERFGDVDPSNDPDFVFATGSPFSCVACHAAPLPVQR